MRTAFLINSKAYRAAYNIQSVADPTLVISTSAEDTDDDVIHLAVLSVDGHRLLDYAALQTGRQAVQLILACSTSLQQRGARVD